MSWLKEIIGTEKAIIAMCHMQPLPGDPGYDRSLGMKYVIEKTKADILALQEGGVDAIIFTAGIGENAPSLRKEICKRLAYLGIGLNEEKNALKGETVEISTPDSKVKVFVIPTNEELMIAKDTVNLIK